MDPPVQQSAKAKTNDDEGIGQNNSYDYIRPPRVIFVLFIVFFLIHKALIEDPLSTTSCLIQIMVIPCVLRFFLGWHVPRRRPLTFSIKACMYKGEFNPEYDGKVSTAAQRKK